MQGVFPQQPQIRRAAVILLFLLIPFFLTSCSSIPLEPTQKISAYSTSSAEPWMRELFACADKLSIAVEVTANEPDLYLRLGEPDALLAPAYQIGEQEILIVTNRQSPLQSLDLGEAQALFAGGGDSSVQVWVYPSELEMQGLFDQFVMQGRAVTSSARVAVNPQEMSDRLNAESNAVGFLPARWKADDVREVYSLGNFAVLAILKDEPQGGVAAILACLQNN